jgi:transcription antitermination factor NusG
MCEETQAGISDFKQWAGDRPARQPNGGSRQWFALVVKPRFDKAVARTLELKGYETLLPLYKRHHQYGARSKSSELPLFPGYVCCRFDVHSRLPILTTPGVIQVLGAGNTPIPVSDTEITSLQTAISAQLPIQPVAFLNDGERVRISGGVLAGIEGIVIKSKPSLRLILSVTLLQRSVLLEIDRDQIGAYGALEPAEDGLRGSSVRFTDAEQSAGCINEL